MIPVQVHPLCLTSTDLAPADFEALKSDIQENGQHHPILTSSNLIVDGRHRYRACFELNIEPTFEDIGPQTDDYLRKLILSLNEKRRHETPAQRALSYTRLQQSSIKPSISPGGTGTPSPMPSQKKIMAETGVGESTAKQVQQIAKHATEKVQQAVLTGQLSAKTAAAISKQPRAQQDRVLEQDPNAIRARLAAEKSSRTLGTSAYVSNHSSQPIPTSDIPRASIEALYAANKASWNSPPPPTARQIIDAILSLQ